MSTQGWNIDLSRRLRAVGGALRSLSCGLVLTVIAAAPAAADDTEIFRGNQNGSNPNILLIIDTSGSMNTELSAELPPFDPTATYDGDCVANRIYWRKNEGTAPNCANDGSQDNWFDPAQLTCAVAASTISAAGFSVTASVAQWNPTTQQWAEIPGGDEAVSDQPVECEADAGQHGPNATDTRRWPANVTQWTSVEADRFPFLDDGTDTVFVFYSANYLNYLQQDPADAGDQPTRIEVVRAAATSLVQTISNVNLGLMRYSANASPNQETSAQGGMVIYPITPIDSTSRTELIARINDLTPAGFTPMAETLYEARQYFSGSNVAFGLASRRWPDTRNIDGVEVDGLFPSVPESRNGDTYLSPATSECQQNYIIYLTDGLPTNDNEADDEIEALIARPCDGTGEGRCLDDVAGYLNTVDQRPGLATPGDQTVRTYTVGFGEEVSGSALLQSTASRGGGRFFEASDSVSLTAAFNNIVAQINATGSTFVAPTLAVNAFNRTETLSDVYMAVFEPGTKYHWTGNIKKYDLQNGTLVDADGDPAVAPNGSIANGTRSFWSNRADGPNVPLGGAANELPAPDDRNLYTYLGTDPLLTADVNAVEDGNTALTDTLLGLNQPGAPTRADLIDWARGADVRDVDRDPATTVRNQMGDPLHGQPAVVIYGGTADDPEGVLFAPTNDGYLHAIDTRTGEELWAFIPQDLLARLPSLFANNDSATKQYGLDSEVRAFKIDINGNGAVDGADKVYLFFGMGRGGSNYFALDVTSKNAPQHLWTLGPTQLPGIGQTWAAPAITRVDVSGVTQNPLNLALVLSGGYDPTQDDDLSATLYNADTLGNRIFIVDAINGNLLWTGGGTGVRDAERNLELPRMNNSIPAGVRVIDFDSDGFADRMYAADTGGRVWRFDVVIDTDTTTTGIQVPTSSQLITGGRFATLGAADPEAQSGNQNTRRFYNTPDVALIRRRGADAFYAVSLGSGWRGHPLNVATNDQFFSLRDYAPFTKFNATDAALRDADPITVGDLEDITDSVTQTVGVGRSGWRLELRLPNGFNGEKVLAESRTFDNVVFFPTYLPDSNPQSCGPTGRNRVYSVSVDNGAPVRDVNRDAVITTSDRWAEAARGGILGEVTWAWVREGTTGPGGGGPGQGNGNGGPNGRGPPLCMVGLQVMPGLCSNLGAPVRTYWRQTP